MNEYQVRFGGLKNGLHSFSWRLDKAFLADYGIDQLQDLNAEVQLRLEKKPRIMDLNFRLEGKVVAPCDRCNEPAEVEFDNAYDLVVKFSHESDFTDDAVVFIDEAEHSLDVGQFIYEYLMVGLPSRILHDEGSCDPEIELYLEEATEEEQQENESVDPRWEALKKIKTND